MHLTFKLCVLLTYAALCTNALSVGRGIADITGLASEAALYGYANPNQIARGLHLRQYSRAFVFDDGVKVAAFVVVETTMVSQAVHTEVFEKLRVELGNIFTEENVMLSPIHTHSAPGGYHTFWMYQAPSKGFVNETFDAFVNGVVLSIVRAYNDLRPAVVSVNSGNLLDASQNRSPYAYYNNPPEEIASYPYDVDKQMTVLKITDLTSGDNMGMISFFAVHTTSMKNYNHLISTDSKGYAAQMMERYLNPGELPGKGSILAAFTQTSQGDASPNTDGSRCDITNEYCSYNTSTCPEWPKDPRKCTGRGPAGEQFADTQIIGDLQYQMGRSLFDSAVESAGSTIDFRMQWVNMSDVTVYDAQNNPIKTCRPSMGYSFAAGATDGPGIPPFTQAMLEPLDNITAIIGRVFNMSEELIACHAPKPILLPTGEIENPWPWQPEIVPLQLLRLGNVILVGLPSEVTTMSGRRLENAVKKTLTDNGFPSTIRVITVAMTNGYTSYVTTFEEYQMQRYEGASTVFGPNQLQAYTIKFQELALAMATGQTVPRGPLPLDLRGYPDDALGRIKIDTPPDGMTYGDILVDVESQVVAGNTASVTFVAGNPRNRPTTDNTFLEVQRKVSDVEWTVEATDANWETKFFYTTSCDEDENDPNCNTLSQMSNATISWDIPISQPAATYRLVHYGTARSSIVDVVDYVGTSSEFQVVLPRALYSR